MIRMLPPRSTYHTTSNLPWEEKPMSSQRSSLAEWAGSAIVMAKGSLKIVLASSNVTPCLFSLPLAFSSSHSNWMLICHACNSLIVINLPPMPPILPGSECDRQGINGRYGFSRSAYRHKSVDAFSAKASCPYRSRRVWSVASHQYGRRSHAGMRDWRGSGRWRPPAPDVRCNC